jgi:hypothetical protein
MIDATIVLEYPGATGIVEASWNWPYGIKDMEIFGEKSYLHALNGKMLQKRIQLTYYNVPVKSAAYTSNLVYLADVLRGKINPVNDLSSLENNVLVVRILEAGKAIRERRKRKLFYSKYK